MAYANLDICDEAIRQTCRANIDSTTTEMRWAICRVNFFNRKRLNNTCRENIERYDTTA